jgi:hypothetical protein
MTSPSRNAHQYRSFVVLDKKGFPHISYEDFGAVKYAHWDGDRWRIQLISPSGSVTLRSSCMAIDNKHDTLYISYRDSVDGSLKVAVGQPSATGQESAVKTQEKH